MYDHIDRCQINELMSSIIKWGKSHYYSYPWRETKNMWHALAAEIMLQRTNAEQVVPVYNKFVANYPTPVDYVSDQEADIFVHLGLIWREQQFKNCAKHIAIYGIPEDKVELMKLPGVGLYIAGAFRSLHLEIRDFIVDSNIVRLYGRYFGFPINDGTRRNRSFLNLADIITPISDFRLFNYGLLDFTRSICKPKPDCNSCIIKETCKKPD